MITAADRARDFLVHTLPFVAESERLRVLHARILRRDGSEVAARQGDTPRLSEPEFSLYYDTRLRVLRFSEVEDGDLIEIDVPGRQLTLDVDEAILSRRRPGWKPFEREVPDGFMRRYRKHVRPACEGAVLD